MDMIFVARARHGCYITAVPARRQTLRCLRASARASHANGARRRSGARESVWGSPRGGAPRLKPEQPVHLHHERAVAKVRVAGAPGVAFVGVDDEQLAAGGVLPAEAQVTAEDRSEER